MKLTYYGHSCLLAEHEGKRVLIDPFLSGNPASGVDPDKVKADLIVLTHGHGDHFGDSIRIAQNNRCPIAAVYELAMICQRLGAPAVHAMNIGGGYDFGFAQVKLTPALHSSSVETDGQLLYAGTAAGVILTMGGKTFYHAGDTALFGEFKSIGERYRLDAAALPIGDNFTMGPEEAVLAARWLNVRKVIPVHYNTFPVIRQDAGAFVKALAEHGIDGYALKSGESLEL